MRYLASTILFTLSSCSGIEPPFPPDKNPFTVERTYEKNVGEYPFIEVVSEQLPVGVVEYRKLVYAHHGGRSLHLDLFHPESDNTASRYPAVILVHGGGWRSGSRSHQVPMAQQLAANGYVTVVVEYRLSDEAGYPAAVHDLKAAIRWVRSEKDNYFIDQHKIAILGCSAGGQLASLVGLSNGVRKLEGSKSNLALSSSIQAIINIDGLMDFTSETARKHEDDPRKNPSAAGMWFRGTYQQKTSLWREASPIYYINEHSPPVLFINSSIPRFHVGRDESIELLESYGIYHEVHTLPDTPHPFWLLQPWFTSTREYVVAFLDRVLK